MNAHARLRGARHIVALALAGTFVSGCATSGGPSLVEREYPPPRLTARDTELGKCSWYGPGFHGKRTASGEIYDQHGMTAAHRTLPLGTRIEVTDLATRRSVRVRVNDRGPYHSERCLDLSYAAAKQLGTIGRGVADVEIRVLDSGRSGYPGVRYDLQLGAYRDRRVAERLAQKLQASGARARLERSDAGRTIYHVRVGPFAKRSDAAKAARILEERGFDPVIIELAGLAGAPA